MKTRVFELQPDLLTEANNQMAPDQNGDSGNRIPINFVDSDKETESDTSSPAPVIDDEVELIDDMDEDLPEVYDLNRPSIHPSSQADGTSRDSGPLSGGPELAELVATRAELKRLEAEVKDLRDGLARRQADFENYRKRIERERTGTHDRVVADIAAKLLPVLDNLKRALETEASIEAAESDEFRHFLSGVDLIYKQLAGLLDSLGVKPVQAEGEQFDPHLHEAVVTEPTDEYEPDMVMQEIVRGYTLGDRLIRPALVKVSVRK